MERAAARSGGAFGISELTAKGHGWTRAAAKWPYSVQVVESGSFSAAGDALGLTPSAVSRLVTRIEERLGAQLVHRSTRRLVFTNEGQDYYQSCLRILEDMEDAEQSIAGDTATPRGLLRVNVSLPFGIHYVVPWYRSSPRSFRRSRWMSP